MKTLEKVRELLESARGSVFPSYSAGVWFRGERHFLHGGCGPRSLFDLASLTKVLCTTTLCALLEEQGRLKTDTPVSAFFPGFQAPGLLLTHLLNHSSGFPAWLPLHSEFHLADGLGAFDARKTPPQARRVYEKKILASWEPARLEKEAVYSDLGFLLLGWALEQKLEAPLDALFHEMVAAPLNFSSLQFLPTSPDVAPTEDCPWRRRVLRGEVHDDNCYVLGGVAAHAGLFGHAADVLELGRLWLAALQGKGDFLSRATAERYWDFSHVPSSTRKLGWDAVSPNESSAGRFLSARARGHLGFTGTSIWIDPQHDLVVTLLTNRVHPTRANEKIKAFRPRFHDQLAIELGFGK